MNKQFIGKIKAQSSTILQVAFGLISVALGIYFIKHEQAELFNVKNALLDADPFWMLWGLLLVIAFVVVQGMMYQYSFSAIHQKIRLSMGVSLFLKRNLVSVFLPAGLLTNMLFFNQSVEKSEGVSRTQIYFASSIFSFCSILSAIIIGIPALMWLLVKNSLSTQIALGVLLTTLVLGLVVFAVINIIQKGKVFQFLEKKYLLS